MDLDVVTGAAGTIKLGGRELSLRQLTVGDVGMLTAWLKERTPKPYQAAAERIAELEPIKALAPEHYEGEVKAILLEAREKNKAGLLGDAQAADGLMNGLDGLAYVLWLSVKRNHPDVTLEWLAQALADVDLDSVKDKMDAVNRQWLEHVPKNQEGAAV